MPVYTVGKMANVYERNLPDLTVSDVAFMRTDEAYTPLRFLEQTLMYYCPVDATGAIIAAKEVARRKLSFTLPLVHCLSVAEQEDELVGAVYCAKPLASPRGGILFLAVRKDSQSSGIGSALLNYAEQRLATLGAKAVMLDSTQSAIGFYENHGYTAQPTLKKRLLGPNYRNPLGKNLSARLQ